jgi:hypothetical protein
MQIAQPRQDLFDDAVKAQMLGYQSFELVIHGMGLVGLVLEGLALLMRQQEPGLGEAVELDPDAVGAFLKFFGQGTQIGCVGLMAKEF